MPSFHSAIWHLDGFWFSFLCSTFSRYSSWTTQCARNHPQGLLILKFFRQWTWVKEVKIQFWVCVRVWRGIKELMLNSSFHTCEGWEPPFHTDDGKEEEMAPCVSQISRGGGTSHTVNSAPHSCAVWLLCSRFHSRSSRQADATRLEAGFRSPLSSLDLCFLIDFDVWAFSFLSKSCLHLNILKYAKIIHHFVFQYCRK